MPESVDGFYSSLFSGKAGEGSAMFILSDGVLTGADPLGVCFDGHYEADPGGGFSGRVTVKVPPGAEVVQGVTSGPDGITYEVDVKIPADFASKPFISLATPLGPVNFKLTYIRAIP